MSSDKNDSEVQRIAHQLHRFYEGPSWLGPSLSALIRDIDGVSARQRILPGAHTIWELVLHITAWLKISRKRLSATEELDPSPEEDWPPVKSSWADAKSALKDEARALEQAILAFPDDRLQQRAPAAEPQFFYELLHGVIQHSAYHAGQIMMLKKHLTNGADDD